MRLVFISDTHNHRSFPIPEGDVLVHCGDGTMMGSPREIDRWVALLAKQPHSYKIVVAGNHDWLFERNPRRARSCLERSGVTYLQDSEVVIDGVKFYGSPWQPWFYDWAFNFSQGETGRNQARETWAKISNDTDVLITHGPPRGILDPDLHGEPVGCPELFNRVRDLVPVVHAFGHLHSGNGTIEIDGTVFINASICNEDYRAVQPAHVVDVTDGKARVIE